jgi:hypothetical protein
MNKGSRLISLFLGVSSLFTLTVGTPSCATIGSPDGGERDTIPPQIISTEPANLNTGYDKSGNLLTDFSRKKITIEFDEYYVLRNASGQIYLSPPTDKDLEIDQKGKKLEIRLPDSLLKATTYTLNFGSSITDLTEGNEQKRFKYVFSTGSFIDSFYVEGRLMDAYLNVAVKDLTVMLYHVEDSMINRLDSIPLKRKPSYFGVTNEQGEFLIDFVKSGRYLVFAFDDKNSDLLYNPGVEMHAFVDELVWADSLPFVNLRLSKEELPPTLRNPSHKSWGQIHFPFSSTVNKFEWEGPLVEDSAFTKGILKASAQQDTFKIYFDDFSLDSLLFRITVNDTVIDTALIAMRTYDPPSVKYRLSASPYLHPNDSLKILASRPFAIQEPDLKILRDSDTLGYRPGDVSDYRFKQNLNIRYEDPMVSKLLILPGQLQALGGILNEDTLSLEWKTQNDEAYAILLLQVEADWDAPLVFQLLSDRGKIIAEYPFQTFLKKKLPYLEAGQYNARILEDLNRDGKWTTGSWLKRTQAERMFFYEEKLSLKANWEVENVWKVKSSDFYKVNLKKKKEEPIED